MSTVTLSPWGDMADLSYNDPDPYPPGVSSTAGLQRVRCRPSTEHVPRAKTARAHVGGLEREKLRHRGLGRAYGLLRGSWAHPGPALRCCRARFRGSSLRAIGEQGAVTQTPFVLLEPRKAMGDRIPLEALFSPYPCRDNIPPLQG